MKASSFPHFVLASVQVKPLVLQHLVMVVIVMLIIIVTLVIEVIIMVAMMQKVKISKKDVKTSFHNLTNLPLPHNVFHLPIKEPAERLFNLRFWDLEQNKDQTKGT